MYNFRLNDNEEILLISDNTHVYTDKEDIICTSIITNKRYLILDYPSGIHNSMEDLRISRSINYIKQKEVILEINLTDIKSITNALNYQKITLSNETYLLINDKDIIKFLKDKMIRNK